MDDKQDAPKVPAVTKISNLTDFLGLVQAPKAFQFEIGGRMVQMEVRPLSDDEWSEVRKTGADLKAPVKKDKSNKEVPGEYDYDDPEYMRAATHLYELRRIHALALALPGIVIPGDSLEEKLAWQKKTLPPNLVAALYAAVTSLTSDPIQLAHFTTVAS
jgi:hypothetical protein